MKRTNLLKSLLAPLVAEWGGDRVRAAIDDILTSLGDSHVQQTKKGVAVDGKKERARKPTAVEIVSRMNVVPAVYEVLEGLAVRYDAKKFLATAADIRQFFEDHGVAPPVVKHRSDAFRKIVSLLCELPQDSLESLLANRAYAGPSQLGPLSNAIRRSGVIIREKSSSTSPMKEPDETRKDSPGESDGKDDSH